MCLNTFKKLVILCAPMILSGCIGSLVTNKYKDISEPIPDLISMPERPDQPDWEIIRKEIEIENKMHLKGIEKLPASSKG